MELQRMSALERSIVFAVSEGIAWNRSLFGRFAAIDADNQAPETIDRVDPLTISATFLHELMTFGARLRYLAEDEAADTSISADEFSAELRNQIDTDTDIGVAIDGIHVEGDVSFAHQQFYRPLRLTNCVFTGSIDLTNSDLGDLELTGSRFTSLVAVRTRINGDLILDNVRWRDGSGKGAHVNICESMIDGSVHCAGSKFTTLEGSKSPAFNGWSAQVNNLRIRECVFEGGINFFQAVINGWVSIDDSQVLTAPGQDGSGFITFARRIIGDSVFLNNVEVDDAISFYGMKVGGRFYLTDLKVRGVWGGKDPKDRETRPSIYLEQLNARTDIYLKNLGLVGQLDLSFARTPILFDDGKHWKKHKIVLDGFRYDRLIDLNNSTDTSRDEGEVEESGSLSESITTDSQHWRKLLLCQPRDDLGRNFKLQPWTELAAALRAVGNDSDARNILFEREQRRPWRPKFIARLIPPRPLTINDSLSWPIRFLSQVGLFLAQPAFWALTSIWRVFFDATVGYGYRPERSIGWLGLMLAISVVIFTDAGSVGAMAPTAENVSGDTRGALQDFNPYIYAVDVFIPLVDLQMQRYWIAKSGTFANVWMWVAVISGWVLTTIAVAGFSGALRRER